MLSYDPPELQEQLTSAMQRMEKLLDDGYEFASDAFNPAAEDFDPSEYEDDVTVKADDTFELLLWPCEYPMSIPYNEFICLVDELEQSQLEGNLECWTPKRYYLRVEPMFWGLDGSYIVDSLNEEFRLGDTVVTCSIVTDYTPFGFLIAANGEYTKHFPPVLAEDLFIQVEWNCPVEKKEIRAIVAAFRFEVSATVGVDLRPSPRGESFEWDEDEEELPKLLPLRNLLTGSGVPELLEIYNKAACVNDPEIEILYFTKVFEYVAQTVLRLRLTETIRTKLQSPAALNPSANYILELEELFAEERSYRKDREAIILTAIACCEATELAKDCPSFLSDLKVITGSTKRKQKDAAVEKFAKALCATRNWTAHAKANHVPTGDECPQQELAIFSRCTRIAAQQVIRWYAARPEAERVT